MKSLALMVVIPTLVLCGVAEAQTRPAPRPTPAPRRPVLSDRVFISVNGLFQVNSNDFDDTSTIRVNAENGQLQTDYNVGGGLAFDVSGSVVVWQNLAVGVGLTTFSASTPTTITAQVPHPLFFNQARTVTGDFDGDRSETAVHIQVKWIAPSTTRSSSRFSGDPRSSRWSRAS